MTTTSLKLPEDVKQLAMAAAKHQGITPHAFMVDAIRAAALAAEKRANFVREALATHAEMLASGKGHEVDSVHAYIRARARGESVSRPEATVWHD